MQLRILCILIMLLLGCENGQAGADACENESVFGDGAPAPWFPQWQLCVPKRAPGGFLRRTGPDWTG